jgi:hypothetical protein
VVPARGFPVRALEFVIGGVVGDAEEVVEALRPGHLDRRCERSSSARLDVVKPSRALGH